MGKTIEACYRIRGERQVTKHSFDIRGYPINYKKWVPTSDMVCATGRTFEVALKKLNDLVKKKCSNPPAPNIRYFADECSPKTEEDFIQWSVVTEKKTEK